MIWNKVHIDFEGFWVVLKTIRSQFASILRAAYRATLVRRGTALRAQYHVMHAWDLVLPPPKSIDTTLNIYLDRPGGMREAIRRPTGDGVLDHSAQVSGFFFSSLSGFFFSEVLVSPS